MLLMIYQQILINWDFTKYRFRDDIIKIITLIFTKKIVFIFT